jgi:lysophospholipid acyltransferase (LPLAT)-like uncharacterized protein
VKRFLQSAPAQAAIAWAAARYVAFVARTVRWRIEGDTYLAEFANGPPCIVVFWHETLPSMPIFWLRARKLGLSRPAAVLASRHRDGQLIGRIVRHLGLNLVSGSSSRGGAAGLRALLQALAGGAHAGLTPDGPRGPRRVCAPGAAQLAALSGRLVLPCGARIAPARKIGTWDEMRLPLPFGRGALVCAAPIAVPRDGWQASIPVITAALNEAMDRAGALA